MFERIERCLDRLGLALITWQAGAVALVGLAAAILLASRIVSPGAADELTYIGATPFGERCHWRELYGFGCLNCGMTRSWTHAARGHLLMAFACSPAGAAAFVGIVSAGGLSAVRLLARRRLAPIPGPVLVGLGAAWLAVWLGVFALRSQGFLPVP